MNRRGFVASLLGLLGIGKVAEAHREPAWLSKVLFKVNGIVAQPNRVFDWSENYTDDPQYSGHPCFGRGNLVFIDGRDVSHLGIQKLKTGPDGYLLYINMDSSGGIETELVDLWDGGRIVPEDKQKQMKWQCCRPDGKGGLSIRYKERVKKRELRGHVIHIYVSPES